jgi:hypothetical protein
LPNLSDSGMAVKQINERNLTVGPVVSGIRFSSARFKVREYEGLSNGFYYGNVTLGDPTGPIGQELAFEAIHLNGVEEAVEREAIGLAFTNTRRASLYARILVPFHDDFTDLKMRLRFGVLVPRNGSLAPDILKLRYRKIENPPEHNTVVSAFPSSELTPLDCNFGISNSDSYMVGYYTAESEPFDVKPGDLVFLEIARTPPDNFNDRILLLRKSAILSLS